MYSAPTQWQSDSDPTYTAWMPPEGETDISIFDGM